MDNQANVVGARPGDAERPRESDVAALGRGGRMSRQRKAAVLRLLRGEDLETVSRALGVTAATLTVAVERRPVDRPLGTAPGDAFRDRTIDVQTRQEEAVVGKEARVKEEVPPRPIQRRSSGVRKRSQTSEESPAGKAGL